jgi:hypothetical protein
MNSRVSSSLFILMVHIFLIGLLVILAYWEAHQRLQHFDRSAPLIWPASLMISWTFYFYLFSALFFLIGLKSPYLKSAVTVLSLGFFILPLGQIFLGYPVFDLTIQLGDYFARPLYSKMKVRNQASVIEPPRPYVSLAPSTPDKGSFEFDKNSYRLTDTGKTITLCKYSELLDKPACIELPRLTQWVGSETAKFFGKDKHLYVSLAIDGVWRINLETFQHDPDFFQNMIQAKAIIDKESGLIPDNRFYLIDVKEKGLILRHRAWIFETLLDGSKPYPLALD